MAKKSVEKTFKYFEVFQLNKYGVIKSLESDFRGNYVRKNDALNGFTVVFTLANVTLAKRLVGETTGHLNAWFELL